MKKVFVLIGLCFISSTFATSFETIQGIGAKERNLLMFNFDIGMAIFSKTKIDPALSLSEYGFYDSIDGADSTIGVPINFRVGYGRVVSLKSIVGINLTYNRNFAFEPFVNVIDGDYIYGDYISGKTFYSSSNDAEVKSQQLGVELMAIHNGWIFGIGVSKDIGSNVSFPINSSTLTRDIKGLYLPIRLGYTYNIGENLGLSTELASSIQLSGDSYIHNQISINLLVIACKAHSLLFVRCDDEQNAVLLTHNHSFD